MVGVLLGPAVLPVGLGVAVATGVVGDNVDVVGAGVVVVGAGVVAVGVGAGVVPVAVGVGAAVVGTAVKRGQLTAFRLENHAVELHVPDAAGPSHVP